MLVSLFWSLGTWCLLVYLLITIMASFLLKVFHYELIYLCYLAMISYSLFSSSGQEGTFRVFFGNEVLFLRVNQAGMMIVLLLESISLLVSGFLSL